MNKKGFVLAEAIVVAVFVLGMFTYLAMNVFPLVTKYIQATNYDNPNEVYLVNMLYDELVASNKFDTLEDGVYYFSLEDDQVKVKDTTGVEIASSNVFSQDYFKNMIYKQLRVTSIVVTSDGVTFDKNILSRGMRQYYNYMKDHNELTRKKSLLLEFENSKYSSISKEIEVVESVENIDYSKCFKRNSSKITGWNTSEAGCETMPTELVIPIEINGIVIKAIGMNAFKGKQIRVLKFVPDSEITSIEGYAFSGCGISGELDLPKALNNIGQEVFANNNISEVTFPSSLKVISVGAFMENNITFLNLNEVTKVGNLAFYQNSIFGSKDSDGNIVDLNLQKITVLGTKAFADNEILGTIKLNSALQTIGGYAFENNRIEKLEIGKNITTIGDYAFRYNLIRELIIAEDSKLSKINTFAFAYNQITGKLKLPDSLQTLGMYAFQYNKITELDFGENSFLKVIDSCVFQYNEISGELIIPNVVEKINSHAFSYNQIEILNIGEKVTQIDGYAFNNNNIKSVSLGINLTRIEHGAFSENEIEKLTIPKSVEFIGGETPQYSLSGAFQENKIKELVFEAESKIIEIQGKVFMNNDLGSVIIPGSIAKIGDDAFADNNFGSTGTIMIKKEDSTGLTLGENWNGNATVIYDPS